MVSRIFSRMAFPSLMVLCENERPEDMSRWRAASLLRPRWKWCNRMWLGKERFGPELIRLMNLAQAAPNVSFSFCWKVRTSIRRAAIRDKGKKARQNLSQSLSQFPFTPPTVWAYHYFALPKRENKNNFHLMVSCVMLTIVSQEHNFSNSLRWV